MKTAHDIILKPVITEASMQGIANKKYTFKVAKDANKIEIAKAVAELFGVKVAKVNTMNVNGRYRRQGMHAGYTADWKKAIVTLTEDSKTIEFFDCYDVIARRINPKRFVLPSMGSDSVPQKFMRRVKPWLLKHISQRQLLDVR